MLTLYNFNVLSESEKADAVWQGTFLADREERDLTIQLYSLNAFYVEVYYHAGSNAIVQFRSFSSLQQLTPYLAHIKFNLRK